MGHCTSKDEPSIFMPEKISDKKDSSRKSSKKKPAKKIPSKIIFEFETDIEKSDDEQRNERKISDTKTRKSCTLFMQNRQIKIIEFESSFYSS